MDSAAFPSRPRICRLRVGRRRHGKFVPAPPGEYSCSYWGRMGIAPEFFGIGQPSACSAARNPVGRLGEPLAVVCPRGGHIHRALSPKENYFYSVGDRLGHIPPFTGEGLAIALGSATLAVKTLRRDVSAATYLYRASRSIAPALRTASFISRIAATGTGQAILMRAAAQFPDLVRFVAHHTRMPRPDLGQECRIGPRLARTSPR